MIQYTHQKQNTCCLNQFYIFIQLKFSHTMSELSPLSKAFLSFVDVLDSFGAETWNLRIVCVVSAAFFLGMRATIGHKNAIDWDALVHAIISGFGASACVYLNYFASVQMRGISEPLGSITCHGPLTSLHRIIPAITQGYAICDIINGFRLGPAFLAHGVATFTVAAIFCEHEAAQILTSTLVMELSTIVLACLRADFFTPTQQLVSQLTFMLLFFLSRIIVFPVILYDIITAFKTSNFEECFPSYIYYVTLLFGSFFVCLNSFWFYKMILKAKRKLSGQESMDVQEKLE